ncbi:glycosyltransferase family 2 protein [Butyrivibrio sp. AC2005]|uniref:glycosyltransferase family 2 protein n=1 Tax=Butyrivibrio sp. AC2005 TaxID=1280672 RepID=UPI000417AA9A|nr:glycosyltransferase [Butyrivibrio sp. AC2005]
MDDNICNRLISVIVPVYNVEKYLNECISSIVNQTYKSFELILIDDGSTDSSGKKCDMWATKDPRITVIHQENGGLSAARNAGLDAMSGEYVCFVDSDDSISSVFLERLASEIERSGADFVFCDIDSDKLCNADIKTDDVIEMNARQCRKWLTNPISREYVLMVVAWAKLYNKRLFDGVRFKQGCYHEDEFMINNFIYSVNKAVYVPERYYYYRNNEGGITGNNNAVSTYHLHVIDAYEDRIIKALDNDDVTFANITLKWGLLKTARLYHEGDRTMKNEAIKKYKYIFNKYYRLLTKKQSHKYHVFEMFPEMFCRFFI